MHNENYTLPVDKEKRIYYQYLGFLNTFDLFRNKYENINIFSLEDSYISFEDFRSFTIINHVTLGKRVELFFEYYINNSKKYKIIKQNLQVISNKITIGEFDFIIEDINTNKIYHIELVYKYYLFKNISNDEIRNYIGPNNHDTLKDKCNKLINKQFPLLYKNESKEYLSGLDIDTIEQKLCLKANLFLENNKNSSFDNINKNCVVGRYINSNSFFKDESFKEYKYFIPQKQDWLIQAKYCSIWYNFNDIYEEVTHLLSSDISPLVWMKSKNSFELMFIGKNY